MAPNPVSLIRKSPTLFRYVSRSPSSKSSSFATLNRRFSSAIPIQNRGLGVASSHYNTLSLNSNHHGLNFEVLSRSKFGFRAMYSGRLSAVSNDGVGGIGGGAGGSGGGNSGGSGDESGGGGGWSNWSLLSWYLAALEAYPVLTKALTAALLTFFGDLICQLVIDQVSTLDVKRTFIFTFLGFVLVGPTLHFWYLYLSKLVTTGGASGAIKRLLLDQFIFSPIFIGFFLSTLVTLEGRPSQVVPKLQQEWFSAVLANWQLWIPFQFLNFRFVPQKFQVLAANVIALAWNVILSFKAHKEILPK